MNKFTKKPSKEFDIKKIEKNNHLRLKIVSALLVTCFIFAFFGLFAYLVSEFIQTHTFKYQSPIVIQKPIIIKRVEIISPLSSKSAMLNRAYAEEVKSPFDPRSPKGLAWEMVKEKWDISQWGYFEELIQEESGWNPYSINSSSGACGLGQALPCSKLGVELWDYQGQIDWIGSYVKQRYGDPASALNFHDEHGYY